MRIGIDGACLANRRGFGRFARRTLAALAAAGSRHDLVVLVDRPSLDRVEIPAGVEVVPVDVGEAPSSAASAAGRRRLPDLLKVSRAFARARLDLAYFPATYSFVPVWNVRRVVVTMHDALAVARPELVFPTRAGRWAWWLKERVAAAQADLVLTVSEASRRDLLEWFPLEPERVRVIPEAPDPAFGPTEPGTDSDRVLARYGLGAGTPYLLYVGGLSPHKNLPRLIRAFGAAAVPGVELVLVGDLSDVFHTHVPELRAEIDRLGVGDRVRFTGFVPDDDLAHLYTRAEALAQPSLLEGFGLPPLEAMACGTPVAYSRAGSLPEVVGEAGLSFDPRNVDEMAGTLLALLTDRGLRDRLARAALARSSRFTWEATARAVLEAFDFLDQDRTTPRSVAYHPRGPRTRVGNTKAS